MFILLLLSQISGGQLCISTLGSELITMDFHLLDHFFFLLDYPLHLNEIVINILDLLLVMIRICIATLFSNLALLSHESRLLADQPMMLVLTLLKIMSKVSHCLEVVAVESGVLRAVEHFAVFVVSTEPVC